MATTQTAPEMKYTVIDSRSRDGLRMLLAELWQYRELIYFLVWRDVMVRYKQTVLGLMWAVLQPLIIALTLSLFLGRLAHLSSDGLPYPVFAYSAMILWQLFSQALTGASNSMLENERLVTKSYFPRLVIPIAAVLASLLDFAVALVVLVGFLAWFRVAVSWTLLLLPCFVLLTVVIASGVGFLLAALNVRYRDVRYTLAFLVQFWFLATPIAYSSSVVPQRFRFWYGLNPMVGVVEAFRWSLRGAGPAPLVLLAISCAVALLLLLIGLAYFQHAENTFADTI
ncbi:MAG: ABC transporter permease [Acidobacteriota bacterium]|nr:ABC transporter permease [Acidobacteriota bacterium]